ncbi:hypothetical protein K440DRAFT_622055 [Wilcoxina mikolae CBS 423.85]|nr:hypothetical protein K440DRAFT_622055 [Wilcoxina mikolae CBS 423.85]
MSGPPPEILARTQEWEAKLKGKDVTSEQVKRELPQKHRVIKPGAMVTKDFVEDRLNVHVDAQGVCTHCTHG